MNTPNRFFVFDVESAGLHGEGYAVGYVVIDRDGNQHEQGMFACPLNSVRGSPDGFKWCRENAPDFNETHDAPWMIRAAFWRRWLEWKDKGAVLAADCAWPVEARFLAQCVDDNPGAREWQGPYPLHDIATLLLACGSDPLAERDRLPGELPKHNPLADAKQSARILLQSLPVAPIPA
jgi:hypothetical protein